MERKEVKLELSSKDTTAKKRFSISDITMDIWDMGPERIIFTTPSNIDIALDHTQDMRGNHEFSVFLDDEDEVIKSYRGLGNKPSITELRDILRSHLKKNGVKLIGDNVKNRAVKIGGDSDNNLDFDNSDFEEIPKKITSKKEKDLELEEVVGEQKERYQNALEEYKQKSLFRRFLTKPPKYNDFVQEELESKIIGKLKTNFIRLWNSEVTEIESKNVKQLEYYKNIENYTLCPHCKSEETVDSSNKDNVFCRKCSKQITIDDLNIGCSFSRRVYVTCLTNIFVKFYKEYGKNPYYLEFLRKHDESLFSLFIDQGYNTVFLLPQRKELKSFSYRLDNVFEQLISFRYTVKIGRIGSTFFEEIGLKINVDDTKGYLN